MERAQWQTQVPEAHQAGAQGATKRRTLSNIWRA